MKKRLRDYLWNILVGLDQFLNTVRAGHPDETFPPEPGARPRPGNSSGESRDTPLTKFSSGSLPIAVRLMKAKRGAGIPLPNLQMLNVRIL